MSKDEMSEQTERALTVVTKHYAAAYEAVCGEIGVAPSEDHRKKVERVPLLGLVFGGLDQLIGQGENPQDLRKEIVSWLQAKGLGK